MDDVLTWDEIVERYPDEWVLIDEPEFDEVMELVHGRIVAHSDDADDVHAAALRYKLRDSAFLFTGQPDPNLVFIF